MYPLGKPTGRKKSGGRQKGTPNRRTSEVKEILREAFEGVGGVQALIAWGKREENRTEFYKLWVKIIPAEVHHSGIDGKAIQVEQKIDFSKVPSDELIEYESVLAKLRSRSGETASSGTDGDLPQGTH
jgi:hypothetical protein